MPVFMSKRKIQRCGTSLAITLPSLFVKGNEVRKGSEMKIHYELNGIFIVSNTEEPSFIVKSLVEILYRLDDFREK